MSDQTIIRLRGRIIEDAPRDPDQLTDFAEVFTEVLGHKVYPSNLRIQANDILKFKPRDVVQVGVQQRIIVPAKLRQYPVFISHRFPMRPPLTQKLLVFSDVDLFEHLDLAVGMTVGLDVDRSYLGRAHLLDWARSIGNVLDGGIGR